MRTYTQLTQEQKYQIYSLMKAGHNQSEIAHLINVHKSTISGALRRNRGMKRYRPKQAHQVEGQKCTVSAAVNGCVLIEKTGYHATIDS